MMRFIVAIDNQRGMATAEGIPWKLPTDQKFFSDQIADGLILMGCTTYTEIGQPLHDKTNYVATRRTEKLRDGFEIVHDVPAFIAEHHDETIQNVGGAGLFTSTLDQADELVVTRVEGDFHCIRFFPPFEDRFERIDASARHEENGIGFTFETWHPRREP